MSVGNAMVTMLLRSPVHVVLSGTTDVIRYVGRRSGRVVSTPTQYAKYGDDLVILVGRPASKQWWRNFSEERDLDVLLRGSWQPMRGRAVRGADGPDEVRPLLGAYLTRFPRASKSLEGSTDEEHVRNVVLVRCRPR